MMSWYKQASQYRAYHGSPEEFQEFSYEFLGMNGTAEGYGFYFTSDKSIADGFAKGGMVKEVYLDINNPLSFDSLTISPQELKSFLRELDPSGTEYLSNWGEAGYDGYDNVLNSAVDGEMGGSDNDVDLISGIINAAGGSPGSIYPVLKRVLGYDGIIVSKPSWGGSQVVYIVFDNSQIRNKI
jgi:hypothetical protein